MLVNRVKAVLVILTIYLHHTHGVVQFSFNKGSLAISEGGDLPSQLSVLRTSPSEGRTITFQVQVIPGTARENEDYIPNSGFSYVFTSNTSQLPVATQLVGDRAGEPIETFAICLPDAEVLRSMGAEAVQPSCANITIVDDDSVVVGFKNSLEGVVEGRTTLVCVEVKPEGLRLDPFDRVPLSIRTNPASSEIQLNTSSLVFENSISENCSAMVTAANDDNTNMGNRSYTLILERASEMSTVPVEIYPNTVPIYVVDDDATGPDTSFIIVSQQSATNSLTVLEGSTVDGIQVQKLRSSALTYNVTLTSSDRSNDVVFTSFLIFDPFTTQKNVVVEISEHTMYETRKEFSISIDRIIIIGAPDVTNLATRTGEPVTIIVYDNDFEVGFTTDEFSVTEGSSNSDVCVAITKPRMNSDIEPSLTIPITVMLESSTSSNLVLDRGVVLLNATSKTVCLTVSHTADNSSTRRYSIQLMWTDDQAGYNVDFNRQNATIVITDTYVSGQRGSLDSGAIAGIVIAVLLLLIIIGVAIFIISKVVIKGNKYVDSEEDDKKKVEQLEVHLASKPDSTSCEENLAYAAVDLDIEKKELPAPIPGGDQELEQPKNDSPTEEYEEQETEEEKTTSITNSGSNKDSAATNT